MPRREWQQLSLHSSPSRPWGTWLRRQQRIRKNLSGISASLCPSTGLENRAEMDNELRLMQAKVQPQTFPRECGDLGGCFGETVSDAKMSQHTQSLSQGGGQGYRDK